MIEKEVKKYRRSKEGKTFTYRIHLSKEDGFDGGETVIVLNKEDYEELLRELEEKERRKDELMREHEEYVERTHNDNKELLKMLEANAHKVFDLTTKLNNYKDTIAGLKILIGKYKHRSLISRLMNKPVSLDSEDQELLLGNDKI